jgi:hypothetical protein
MVAALIVRMPDNRQYRGLRRWIDRMEVDEMIVREEDRRLPQTNVITMNWADPASLIEAGMKLYFVGHGSPNGFLADDYIAGKDIAEWIDARKKTREIIAIDKIKLVTCNAGSMSLADMGKPTLAEQLAKELKGIVTGRVIAYSAYICSTPDYKATYFEEPEAASLGAKTVQRRLADRENKLRTDMVNGFCELLMDKGGTIAPAGQKWAEAVLINPKQLEHFKKAIPSIKGNKAWVDFIGSRKSGVRWPAGKGEDLEDMLRVLDALNARVAQAPDVGDVPRTFMKFSTLWKEKMWKMASEWTWRKKEIAIQFEKQKGLDSTFYEKKATHTKMAERQRS